jgi:hypothetical protein
MSEWQGYLLQSAFHREYSRAHLRFVRYLSNINLLKADEVMEQQSPSTLGEHVRSASLSDTGVTKQGLHRRKRLRLSCAECRSKKVSHYSYHGPSWPMALLF